MSKLRSINTAFWSDTWIEDLEPNYKLLFLYLVTNDKTNMLGIYESSVKKIAFETGLSVETVNNGLKAFETVSKVKYINNYIILVNYMKHQNYNTNMKKSAIDIYNSLPKELKDSKLSVSKEDPLKGFESLLNHYGMVRKVEVEYETELEEEKEDEDEEKYFDFDAFYDLDVLANYYLSKDQIVNAVISLPANKIKDKEHLENRMKDFKQSLIEQGRVKETFKEFAKYFRNWVKSVEDYNKKPNEVPNPNNEKIITFTSNANPSRQQLPESEFLSFKERMQGGGYIFKIIE